MVNKCGFPGEFSSANAFLFLIFNAFGLFLSAAI